MTETGDSPRLILQIMGRISETYETVMAQHCRGVMSYISRFPLKLSKVRSGK